MAKLWTLREKKMNKISEELVERLYEEMKVEELFPFAAPLGLGQMDSFQAFKEALNDVFNEDSEGKLLAYLSTMQDIRDDIENVFRIYIDKFMGEQDTGSTLQ